MTSTFTPIPTQGLTEDEKNEELAALEARLAAVKEAPTRVMPTVTKQAGDDDIAVGARVLVAMADADFPAQEIERFGETAFRGISSARHGYGNRQFDITSLARQFGIAVREAEPVAESADTVVGTDA